MIHNIGDDWLMMVHCLMMIDGLMMISLTDYDRWSTHGVKWFSSFPQGVAFENIYQGSYYPAISVYKNTTVCSVLILLNSNFYKSFFQGET